MDPTAAYKRLWELYLDHEYGDAIDQAEDILNWVDRGGFIPRGIPGFVAETIFVSDQSQRAIDRRSCP